MIEEKLEALLQRIRALKETRRLYQEKTERLEQENKILRDKLREAEKRIQEIISLIDREIGNV